MMHNRIFRWIAFAVSAVLAIAAIGGGKVTGFLCFLAAAFIFIPVNHLPEKLDTEIDPKWRKRATSITAYIFVACGLMTFLSLDSTDSTGTDDVDDGAVAEITETTIVTDYTETTEETTETTTEATTEETTATTEAVTTTETTTVIAVETEIEETVTEAAAEEETLHFILNTETGCVHISDTCAAAREIDDENRQEIDILESDLPDYAGIYWACGRCSKRYQDELPNLEE